MELHVFQFALITSCPVSGHYREEPGSLLFLLEHQVLIQVEMIPLSLLSSLSLSLYRQMLQFLSCFCGPMQGLLQQANLFLCSGAQTQAQPSDAVLLPKVFRGQSWFPALSTHWCGGISALGKFVFKGSFKNWHEGALCNACVPHALSRRVPTVLTLKLWGCETRPLAHPGNSQKGRGKDNIQ